jgi:hypothetical protein
MNDLHELVHALEPDVPTLTSTQVDRQRARLMTAAQAEVIHQPTSSEVPEGARTSTAPKRRTRRRHVFFASALTGLVAAGVIVALVVVQPGPGGPRTAAAAVLDQAAAVAGQQSPGPGQYLYTETQSTYQMTNYKANSTTGALDQVATASYGETDQSWTDAAGTGQVLRTYGAAVYSSVADQMEFLATNAAQGGRPIFGGQAEPEAPAIDVSDLPTDPTTLGPVLAAGQMGTSQYIAAGPDATFERAARLLIGPTTGMSPTLASALFQVMADQPGARSLGTVTDHDGEQGEGVALGDATNTQVAEVIVDPDQGRLLEVDYAVPGTTSAPPGGAACANSSSGLQCTQPVGEEILAPLWTDLVASGVVGSNTESVPASGTATITATQVPGAPTSLEATVVDGTVHLSWTAPSDQGVSPVTDYLVYAGASDSPGNGGVKDTQSTATTYDWIYSPGGQPVTFNVQAANAQGAGLLSASVTVVP